MKKTKLSYLLIGEREAFDSLKVFLFRSCVSSILYGLGAANFFSDALYAILLGFEDVHAISYQLRERPFVSYQR